MDDVYAADVQAVELSALRQAELVPMIRAIPSLNLSGFDYVSIHAPSQFEPDWERAMWEQLAG